MGNGGQYHGVADMHEVDKSTICRNVHRVVTVINLKLFGDQISWPTNGALGISQKFLQEGRISSRRWRRGWLAYSHRRSTRKPRTSLRRQKKRPQHQLSCGLWSKLRVF